MKRIVLVFALSLCVFLVGCNSAVVTVVVQSTIDAAAIITAISDPNLTPAQKTLLLAYAQQASVAVLQVSNILSTGGTPAQMALDITAALGSLVVPDLKGEPAAIVAAVTKEAQDISNILKAYATPVITASARANPTNAAAVAEKPVHFGSGDLARLKAAQVKVAENEAAIARLR